MAKERFTADHLAAKGYMPDADGNYSQKLQKAVTKVIKTEVPGSTYRGKRKSNETVIYIKPLSVNDAFTGRRFHTEEHREWSKKVLMALPHMQIPEPPYEIYLRFGFSSTLSDWDNCIKQVQDEIAKHYKFNDKLIRRGIVETEMVEKGKEYFAFSLKTLK